MLFQLSYGSVEPVRGIEPRLLGRKPSILPLDDTGLRWTMKESNFRSLRVEEEVFH